LEPGVLEQVFTGMTRACRALGVALIGGETAEMPGLYAAGDYDLVGFILGAVDRRKILDGRRVRSGDRLLGLASTGLHTNGYSLARRILPPDEWQLTAPGLAGTIGEALLEPHRSYLDEIRILRRALRAAGGDIGALAHLTGGGWEGNIPRTLPTELGVEVETGSWPVNPIFCLIQQRGGIADDEMLRTFNMGIGMTAIVPEALTDAALGALPEAVRLGSVVPALPGAPRVAFI